MAATGQTINDRINAVRYALVGQGLARTVCKATTEEVLGPKKKHLDYLLVCTQEPNVSVPQLANLLIERTQHINWAVVFKGLISIHHLMAFGNERFTQYLATSNHSFNLPDFMDRSTPQGYTMSTFVRRYSKYVNDKCISYRNLAIDISKLGTGNDNPLRTMNMDKLSKTLPIVHEQYDSLLEFEAEAKDLNNGIIMAAYRLLYKDLVRLYIAYQEAIINLLERYFKLSRKKTREALELYKQYLSRMDKVAAFFKVADAVGLDKSEMPDLTKSPASILALLEQHLAQLEAKKKGGASSSAGAESVSGTVSPQNNPPDTTDAEVDNACTKLEQVKVNTDETETTRGNESASSAQSETVTQADESRAMPTSSKEQSSHGPQPPPPPKPARPSPATTSGIHKNSQPPSSGSGVTTNQSSKTSPTTTQPQSVGTPITRTQPDRPTKPPSRPPPPSAAASTTTTSTTIPSPNMSSSSTPVKKIPPGHPPAPASKPTTPTPPVAPAPPHPPPPSSTSTHATTSSEQEGSEKQTLDSGTIETIATSGQVLENHLEESSSQDAYQQQQQNHDQNDEPNAPPAIVQQNDEFRPDGLRAPDANNLDRPDSGVGSPSHDTNSEGDTHSGPMCSMAAVGPSSTMQIEVQQVEEHNDSNQIIPNHNTMNHHETNGHVSEDQAEIENGNVIPPAPNDEAGDVQVGEEELAPPPPIDENGEQIDLNHVNNIDNNNSHNGE